MASPARALLGVRLRRPVLHGDLIFLFLHSNRGDPSGLSSADPEGMGDAGHGTGKCSPRTSQKSGANKTFPCPPLAPPPDRENRLRSLPQHPGGAEVFPKAAGSGRGASAVIRVVQKHGARGPSGCSPPRRWRSPPRASAASDAGAELSPPRRTGATPGCFLSLGENLNCSVQPATEGAKQGGRKT